MQPTTSTRRSKLYSPFWRSIFRSPKRGGGRPDRARHRSPVLEALEDRLAPAAVGAIEDRIVGDLQFSGDFQDSSNGWVSNTFVTGLPVQVGFVPQGSEAFNPLLTLTGDIEIPDAEADPTDTTFTIGSSLTGAATISVIPVPSPAPNKIWQLQPGAGEVTFDTELLDYSRLEGQDLSGGTPVGFSVAGVPSGLLASNLALFNPGGSTSDTSDATVILQGNIKFDALGLVGLEVGADGENYVEIDSVTHAISLTGIDADVSSPKFNFGAVAFEGALGASYTPSSNQFGFFGDIAFSATGLQGGDGNSVDIKLGAAGFPGLVVTAGKLEQFTATVTGALKVYELSIAPEALTFQYDETADDITIYGGLTVSVPNGSAPVENFEGSFGTKDDPGLIIDRASGVAEHVSVGVSGEFNFFGFELESPASNPVHFLYDAASDLYELSGEVTAPQLWNTTVVMGSQDQPGVKIQDGNWSVDDLTVGFGNVTIGGFGVRNISATYSQFKEMEATGDLTLGSATISNASSTGDLSALKIGQLVRGAGLPAGTKVVEVSGNQVKLNNAATASATGVALTFDGGLDVDAKGAVEFPQDWVVSGDINFLYDESSHRLYINEVAVKAQNLLIEIGDTGLFLTEIDATVNNVNSSDWVISGHMTVDYGEAVTIYKETVKFFSAVGGFTVDKDHLEIDATVYLGAQKISGKPRGVIGTAEGVLLLDWNKQQYSLDIQAQLYGSVIAFEAEFEFDAGAGVVIEAEADLIVPKGIPLIGGKKVASADVLFKYEKPDANDNGQAQGYVAAWTTIDLWFTKVQAGIKYDFVNDTAKSIGHKSISNLKREASQPQAKTYLYTQSFTVPEGATQATFSVDWGRTFPSGVVPTLTIQGDGIDDIPQSQFDASGSLATLLADLSTSSQMHVGLVGSSANSADAQYQALAVAPGGNYTLKVEFTSDSAPTNSTATILSITEGPVETLADGTTTTVTELTLAGGAPSDLVVGDQFDVSGSGIYDTHHTVLEITDDGRVITNVAYTQDVSKSGMTMAGWTLPQFDATFHIPQPSLGINPLPATVTTDTLEVTIPVEVSSSLVNAVALEGRQSRGRQPGQALQPHNSSMGTGYVMTGRQSRGPRTGQQLQPLTGTQLLSGSQASGATVDLYMDIYQPELGADQEFNGVLVARDLPLDPSTQAELGDSRNGYTVTATLKDLDQLLPFPYYVYAVVNDGVNTPVTSILTVRTGDAERPFEQVFEPEFAVWGNVATQNGDVLSGWTVWVDLNQNGAIDAGEPTTQTDDQGAYGFFPDGFPSAVFDLRVQLLDPDGYAYSDNPGDGVFANQQYTGTELNRDFTIDEHSAIKGTVFEDVNASGNPLNQPTLSGWTVFIDANGNGRWDFGETAQTTGSSGNYSFSNLGAGTYDIVLAMPNGSAATYTFAPDQVEDTTVYDVSGSPTMVSHLGTLTNGATAGTTTGFGIADRPNAAADNQVLKLDSSLGQFVDVPSASDLQPGTKEFSFAAWIYVEDPTVSQAIAGLSDSNSPNDGWGFYISHDSNSQEQLSVVLQANGSDNALTYTAGPKLQANTWYHVAFTYDGTNGDDAVQIFVNGDPQTNGTVTGNTLPDDPDISTSNSIDFAIGARGSDGVVSGLNFGGYLDEVMIWNETVSSVQVQALYQGGSIPTYVQTTPGDVGTYTVTIDDSGTDVQKENNFGVDQLAALTGTVLDTDGSPMAGVGLLVLQDNAVVATTTTFGDGGYVVTGLAPGYYTLRQSVPSGYEQQAPVHKSLVLELGQTKTASNGLPFNSITTGQFAGVGSSVFRDLALTQASGEVVSFLSDDAGGWNDQHLTSPGTGVTNPFQVVAVPYHNGEGQPYWNLQVLDSDSGQINILDNSETLPFSGFTPEEGGVVLTDASPIDMISGTFVSGSSSQQTVVSFAGADGQLSGFTVLGSVGDPPSVLSTSTLTYSGDLAAGNVFGDGNTDLVINGGNLSNHFTIARGDGTGNFDLVRFSVEGEFTNGGPVAIGDVNKDGYMDVALGSSTSGLIVIALQQSDGTFPVDNMIHLTTIPDVPSSRLILGHFNGSNRLALAALPADGSNNLINIFVPQDGAGLPDAELFIPTPLLTATPAPILDGIATVTNRLQDVGLVVLADGQPSFTSWAPNVPLSFQKTESVPVNLNAGDVYVTDFVNAPTSQVSAANDAVMSELGSDQQEPAFAAMGDGDEDAVWTDF